MQSLCNPVLARGAEGGGEDGRTAEEDQVQQEESQLLRPREGERGGKESRLVLIARIFGMGDILDLLDRRNTKLAQN